MEGTVVKRGKEHTSHNCDHPGGDWWNPETDLPVRTVWQCPCGRRWRLVRWNGEDYSGTKWRRTLPTAFGFRHGQSAYR